MKKKLILKRGVLVALLLIVALLSIFVFAKIATSPKFHQKSIQNLDNKKMVVMELTAATAIASTGIALVPGDATTPLANQIMELSSYLLIIVGAIFLEKVLLTLTGYITFYYLIPVACALYAIYLFVKKEILKSLAIKLAVLGIAIFMVVPISVQISNLIDSNYQSAINQTIEEAKNDKVVEENKNETTQENGGWNEFTSNIKDAISNVSNNVSQWIHKGEKMLSDFIDAIAVLLITSCVIPIVVLLVFLWIVKIILGINISVPKIIKQDEK